MEEDQEKTHEVTDYYGSGIRGVVGMKLIGSDLEAAIKNLVETICRTTEYKTYSELKGIISRHPEKKEKIRNLREVNYRIQNMPEGIDILAEEERLEDEIEELCTDAVVNDFMQAELDFCRMFQDILSRVAQEIDFE